MTGGTEWLIDASNCTESALCDADIVRSLVTATIEQLELTEVGRNFHQFSDPAGVTLMVLLAESHLTIHTFPEAGVATLNLYSCTANPKHHSYDWQAVCSRYFGAKTTVVRRFERGLAASTAGQRAAS